jgi:uncharacterized protein (TIGR02996 family)
MSDMRQALEAALFASPDDLATHMAYADYLSDQGDPRGEFIQVQLALEDEGKPAEGRKKLQQREQELLDAHEPDWLGTLAPLRAKQKGHSGHRPPVITHCHWARGWVDDLSLLWIDLPVARALAGCRAADLLRRLQVKYSIHNSGDNPEQDEGASPDAEYPDVDLLAQAPFRAGLRVFQLGEMVDFEEDTYNCTASGEGVSRFLRGTTRLEELYLFAHAAEAGQVFALRNLTNLRVLVVYHEREYPLEVLAANPALHNLTILRMHPRHGWAEEGSYLPLAQVRALLRSPHLTALKELHLHGSDLGDEGCEEIVRSGILKRLEVLDLRHGRVTDWGARALVECPDVRRLQHLSLEDNQLTDTGRALLRGLGIDVRCKWQEEVGSQVYLYSGDME